MTSIAWAPAVFLGASVTLLALPFVPAWREWRRPTDAAPLPVPLEADRAADIAQRLRAEVAARAGRDRTVPMELEMSGGRAVVAAGDYRAGEGSSFTLAMAGGDLDFGPRCEVLEGAHADGVLRLREGCTALRRLSAGTAIELERGCCFERLEAPVVRFGGAECERADTEAGALPPGDWATVAGAQPRNARLVRVQGDCVLAAGRRYRGSLIVHGALCVETNAVLDGDVKATRGVLLQAGARVNGAVICDADIQLMRDAGADGPVVCTADVMLSAGARIGRPGAPTTLTAPGVIAEAGAVAHGVVWAHRLGIVWEIA